MVEGKRLGVAALLGGKHSGPSLGEVSTQWKRASSPGKAGTSGFLSVSDSDHRVPAESAKTRGFHTQLDEGPETP